jgi:hypothetical protein
MHAVVGKWLMDPAQQELQDQVLNEQILPMVKQVPGFVCGYWGRAADGAPEGVTFVVFDDQAAAEGFAATVNTDPEGREQHGVESSGWLTIVEIAATA